MKATGAMKISALFSQILILVALISGQSLAESWEDDPRQHVLETYPPNLAQSDPLA